MAKYKNLPNQERFLRIRAGVYQSEAFRTLPDPALKLWIDLRTQFYGHNNGQLIVTLRTLAPRGWKSNSKLQRARDELLRRGLIRRTKYCGPNVFHRASRYAFTDEHTAANDELGIAGTAPSHDYLRWTRNTAICGSPQKGANGTRKRIETAPSKGEHPSETIPAGGERLTRRKPSSIKQFPQDQE
jgi:hypothetical protein